MTELSKKAAKMLLDGATLVSEPCPYCGGVRVIKGGHALCADCGKEPKEGSAQKPKPGGTRSALERLEKKMDELIAQLENVSDPQERQATLESIDTLAGAISKLRG